jgi:hypothetical protein
METTVYILEYVLKFKRIEGKDTKKRNNNYIIILKYNKINKKKQEACICN